MTQTLAPRLLKGVQADYIPSEWAGSNTSGFTPYGKHILVRVDECSPKTAGGLDLPDDMVWKMTQAAETGCVYAMSEEAFMFYDNGRAWSGDRPQVGDRIYFERFAGVPMVGKDGAAYRTMDFRCVYAGLDKTATEETQ